MKSTTTKEKSKKRIMCRECEGFGHIQADCANTLKNNKYYVVNWSDNDYDSSKPMLGILPTRR